MEFKNPAGGYENNINISLYNSKAKFVTLCGNNQWLPFLEAASGSQLTAGVYRNVSINLVN